MTGSRTLPYFWPAQIEIRFMQHSSRRNMMNLFQHFRIETHSRVLTFPILLDQANRGPARQCGGLGSMREWRAALGVSSK